MRVGIVGCGLIGARRAHTAQTAGDDVVTVADLDAARGAALAADSGARSSTDWRAVVDDPQVDAVVVATFNAHLVDVTVAALERGKHVLCEKPLGTSAAEAARAVAAMRASGRVLKVGFTLRHHPAVAEAQRIAAEGSLGRPVALRAAYGHGGRAGYESEWRGDPRLAGGGELLDQGVHLVDLSRWFLGEFDLVRGVVATLKWPIEPLEDNGFALLQTEDGRVASLHTSWTQWRNLFRLEVLLEEGALTVEGLGGSYGPERLTIGRRVPGAPPLEEVISFPDDGSAWVAEWAEFADAASEGRTPIGSADDGYAAARILDALYRSARSGRRTPVRSAA